MYDKAIIEGYAPPDLIFRLRLINWKTCEPSGKNFFGIEFGDAVLADTYDPYCPMRHRVTISEIPHGQTFQVEGYCAENACAGLQSGAFRLVIAGCTLDDLSLDKIGNSVPYRATVELIIF
ncbi:MAG: hypothetical protein HYT37_00005 [Candidatus Sungbacteria bacterium]|nr:hypothetical protein [Candidatus Sungbacteria bacterium]